MKFPTKLLISVWSSLMLVTTMVSIGAGAAPSKDLLILRVRKTDGSMDRVVVPKDQLETTTLSSILSSYISEEEVGDGENKSPKCQIGNGGPSSRTFTDVTNADQSISSFNLQNGSIINIIPSKSKDTDDDNDTNGANNNNKNLPKRYTAFDPYPDIAKSSYSMASRRSKALSRLPSKRSMSYGDITKLRDHMHTFEPQAVGPIKRIYMCHLGAQRFKDNCTIMPTKKQLKAGQKEIKHANRCAILFGTTNTERVDQSKRKARTSLSTPLYEMEMCKVVKVHAVWEPLGQNTVGGDDKPYDYTKLWGTADEKSKDVERAIHIANLMGLKMVGWIYSYSDDRNNENSKAATSSDDGDEPLPVFGRDMIVGAMGQIDNMQRIGREDGSQFITLALDAKTGATEAFQLSDVSVQVVAEGKVNIPEKSSRYLETTEPVVIHTKETTNLDSVLCLVNTAMLSHEGNFSGGSTKSSIKKGGALTLKTRKNIIKKMDTSDTESLMASLCDFNILMALDRSLGKKEMDELCNLVKKYSRGQRKAAKPSNELRLALKNLLGG